jgi:AbrB family looped-hinge helix DNA binding protein
MSENNIFRSRLRQKGQVTVPSKIRSLLNAEEGDELVFQVDEKGRVVMERAQIIPPDQAWFWSERWQRLEREVQQDLEDSHTHQFESAEEALDFLNKTSSPGDAKDRID